MYYDGRKGPPLCVTVISLVHWSLCRENAGNVRTFVIMSASWPLVSVYVKSMILRLCQYRITWCLTSTYLVLLVVMKLVAIWMHASLSSRNKMGSRMVIFSSFRKERSQTTAFSASMIARYSAVAVDCAGAPGCSLHPKSYVCKISCLSWRAHGINVRPYWSAMCNTDDSKMDKICCIAIISCI